ncbi:sugar phosphate nucleotidyltransferase [Pelagibacteraceae bacterium]|nr:sugar phosphate nucleotidyltransferase [Pelagibacteraceae bacterium]
MTQFLILPLGGVGQRFHEAGYKTYKPFLKISNKLRVIDKIINNFPKKNTKIIVIGSEKKFQLIKSNLKKKAIFIKIENHKLGPLNSIYLARNKLKIIIGKSSFFIVYSDINWNWNFKKVKKFITKKNSVIFTHTGYHPDLEVDSGSDFCQINKHNHIKKVSEKKLITSDYKKNLLATGCYYFKKFEFIENFLKINKKIFKNKIKEYYLISLVDFLIKKKIKINIYNVKNFVHLGVPSQYENFIKWKKILIEDFNKSLKLKSENIMLMAGKGKRVQKLKEKKPFLKIINYKIYEYILYKFGSKKNSIITNKNYYKNLNKKFNIYKIDKSNSMMQTVEKSLSFLKKKKNYFITSCDCFGIFNKMYLNNLLKKENPDIILFAFDLTDLQKTLKNSHTTITIKKNKIISINVKQNHTKGKLGHAGFFWIKNNNVFRYINEFKFKNKFSRELILDDYFKFLFDKKKFNIKCLKLDNYVHIGSIKEYKELEYWKNYFENEN